MQIITYTPHGAVPDLRGFAPALVATEISKHLGFAKNIHVCAREGNLSRHEFHAELGEIHRIGGSAACTRLRKITGFDLRPLHGQLANLCREIQPALVHAHQTEFPVNDFRRRLGRTIPVVVHAHSVRSWNPSMGLAEHYIAVSNFTRTEMLKRGFPAERTSVIPNGADTDLFSPADAITRAGLRTALGISQEKFVLTYVGRKQAAKGFVTFLQTLDDLVRRGFPVQGLAAGPTPADAVREEGYAQRENLREDLIRRNCLIDIPALGHKQLANVYRAADCLLFATQADLHPLVLIEALASGCLIITSRLDSIAETVTDGTHAMLLDDPKDVQAASRLIEKIMASPEAYAPMRTLGRQLAREHYDWRGIAGKVEQIYFSLT